jgi:hypothetical protein
LKPRNLYPVVTLDISGRRAGLVVAGRLNVATRVSVDTCSLTFTFYPASPTLSDAGNRWRIGGDGRYRGGQVFWRSRTLDRGRYSIVRNHYVKHLAFGGDHGYHVRGNYDVAIVQDDAEVRRDGGIGFATLENLWYEWHSLGRLAVRRPTVLNSMLVVAVDDR